MRKLRLLLLGAALAALPALAEAQCVREVLCADGVDNDSDSDVDCGDSDCFGHQACTYEDCTNGIDDDADSLADCADPQCAGGQDFPTLDDMLASIDAQYLRTTADDSFTDQYWVLGYGGSVNDASRVRLSGGRPYLDPTTSTWVMRGSSIMLNGGPCVGGAQNAILSSGQCYGSYAMVEARAHDTISTTGPPASVILSAENLTDNHRVDLMINEDGMRLAGQPGDHFMLSPQEYIQFLTWSPSETTLESVAATADRVIRLPDNDGTTAVVSAFDEGVTTDPIRLDTAGVVSCPTCAEDPDIHKLVLEGPEDYLSKTDVPTPSGVEQHLYQDVIDVTDHTTLAVAGGADPLVLTPGATRGAADKLSCPTCLYEGGPLRWIEEVTQLTCSPASTRHPTTESTGATLTWDNGPPHTWGEPQSIGGASFADPTTGSDLQAIECHYRVPLAYEPDDPSGGARRPLTFDILGYGYTSPATLPGCAGTLRAKFDVRLKVYRPGDTLFDAWDLSPLAAVPNNFEIEIPCASPGGPSVPWTLDEASIEFDGVEPGDYLVFSIRRLDNDPVDTWNAFVQLTNGRLSYPVVR